MTKYLYQGKIVRSSEKCNFCVLNSSKGFVLGARFNDNENFNLWEHTIDDKVYWVTNSKDELIELRNLIDEVLEDEENVI